MKFIIASSGKYHHFNLAKSLFKKNNLTKIFTGYPWFKIKREMIKTRKDLIKFLLV